MVNADDAIITQQTLNWIQSVVIDYNICPFAKRVVDQGTLSIQVTHVNQLEGAIEALMSAVCVLSENPNIETILLVFPAFLHDFFDYLDFTELAEELLFSKHYEGVYQLATFHPDYCFADVEPNDVSNYTNRSPYPMLHLLREASIDLAIKHYGNTEDIPLKNIATMRRLGLVKIKQLLQNTGD